MEEIIESIIKQSYDKAGENSQEANYLQDDYLREDFLNKRALLFDDSLKMFSNECHKRCINRLGKGYKRQEEEHINDDLIELMPKEEKCVKSCAERVNRILKITHAHIGDQLNPVFLEKYVG